MLAYLGRTIALSELVTSPPHSLLRQSYSAKELRGAVVNADGWGASWYLQGDPEACLYRSAQPIWADANLSHLGRAIRSTCILAAVRSATDSLSLSVANTQPFCSGRLTFVHNGFIGAFRENLLRPLRQKLSDWAYARIHGDTDSEHLFYWLLDAYRDSTASPDRLLSAMRTALRRLRPLVVQARSQALLTLIASDGNTLVFVKTAISAEPPSLYLSRACSNSPGRIIVASEPLDEHDGWQPVDSDTIFHVVAEGQCAQVPAWT